MYRSEMTCALLMALVAIVSTLPKTITISLLISVVGLVGTIILYYQSLMKTESRPDFIWSLALAVLACVFAIIVKGNAAIGLLAIASFLFIRSLLVFWRGNELRSHTPNNITESDEPIIHDPNFAAGIEEIKKQLDQINQKIEQKYEFSDGQFLHDQEIRRKLLVALSTAEHEVDIISPWLSRYAVDRNLISLMEKALQKNVTIKILYGINGANDSYKERLNTSETIATELSHRFKRYDKLFKIQKDNTHEKILLCDERFYMVGSFNLLSFAGNFRANTRREIMLYSENPELIKKLRETYFHF